MHELICFAEKRSGDYHKLDLKKTSESTPSSYFLVTLRDRERAKNLD